MSIIRSLRVFVVVAVVGVLVYTSHVSAQVQLVEQWKYTTKLPADDWQSVRFDDSGWQTGKGGFGTRHTPGSRVGTKWDTNDIWLRQTFEIKDVPAKPALLIHHDEDVQVFINGKEALELRGWSSQYQVLAISPESAASLRTGRNSLAVHCKQTSGGQFIDVHVVDQDHVPELPPVRSSTEPFKSELITQWGAEVTPENAWTEYPRPQLLREKWINLNGKWDYAVTSNQQKDVPKEWNGKILVPFCLESKLGGVQRLLLENEALWYHRSFDSAVNAGKRMLLNFEAVDYECEVFVNGKSVGNHKGGHTPFTLDITNAIKGGTNELVVRVEDKTEGWQLRGKQVINAEGIWYTQVSGIWQTVWLEEVNGSYIEDLTISTDAVTGTINVRVDVDGNAASPTVELTVKDGNQTVGTASGDPKNLSVKVPNAKLWSPDSPHLYALEVKLIDANKQAIDSVQSYAGIRTVGKVKDENGNWRLTLNGKIIFHFGPLDQGWWPDGLLTPPSDEAMKFDIQYLKDAGFNMIRKHIKVEPRRYYYYCDTLGMMMWQDQVSAGHNPQWTRMAKNPEDAVWPDEHHAQYMLELERMIDHLESHPSIVMWVPFNEAWGQHRTMEVGQWTVKRDPSRLVNIASGGNFWPVGDIADHHNYPHPDFPFEPGRYDNFVKVVGEFGGHGYPVANHIWNKQADNWGYGGLPKNEEEYRERYKTSIDKLKELQTKGIAAGIYTQTTDVEHEINGLMTYDRKVIKISAKDAAALHKPLLDHPTGTAK